MFALGLLVGVVIGVAIGFVVAAFFIVGKRGEKNG